MNFIKKAYVFAINIVHMPFFNIIALLSNSISLHKKSYAKMEIFTIDIMCICVYNMVYDTTYSDLLVLDFN